MEGNTGKRLIAPRPRMCAVEAQRRVDCGGAVLHAVLTPAATVRAFSTPTGMLGVPGPMRPCGLSTYLSTTTTETLAVAHGIRLEDGADVELGQNGAGPNYGQRSRRSSPGLAPDPARRRLADIA